MQSLSIEQEFVFNKLKRGENVFLSGSAGTGKSFLIKHFVDYLKLNKSKFRVCALTGTAALLLNCNATTLHSWAGIGLGIGNREKITFTVLKNKKKTQNWKRTKILIVDEVSMLSLKLFEVLENIARHIHNGHEIFGGMQVIFTGDFGQLPPIETFGEPDTKAFCFESTFWYQLFKLENHIELKTIFRQTDPLYRSILLQIRDGNISEQNIQILHGYVNRVFDSSLHEGCVPTKIFPTRIKVDYVNRLEFNKIKEREYVIECEKLTNCVTYLDTNTLIPQEILLAGTKLTQEETDWEIKQIINNSNILQILRIKKGCAVMCTSNIDMDCGICNGSQGVIVDILERATNVFIPIVKFHNGHTKMLAPIFRQSEEFPNIAVGQIPLMLAWSVTIHKTQGASIDMGEIDVGNDIFEYGQTYVALSRIKSLEGLYLTGFDPSKIKANPKVRDFYKNFIDIESLITSTKQTNKPTNNEISFDEYNYKDDETKEVGEKSIKNLKIIKTSHNRTLVVKKTEDSLTISSTECCICLTGPRTILLLPCKHMCLCDKCGSDDSPQIISKCPICRNDIQQKLSVFT